MSLAALAFGLLAMSRTVMPPPDMPPLLHEDLPRQIDRFLEHRGASWRQLLDGKVHLAGAPLTLDELQLHLIALDPVIWCECHLVERDSDDGRPWRFWGFQKASMRYRGHVVHEDGAEVGKTREIVGLALWMAHTRRGDILIGAPSDGPLELIWQELTWQCKQTPSLEQAVNWDETKVKPYRVMRVLDNFVHARTGGLDGEPFRAVHVKGAGLFDEVAKAKNPQVMSEFFRALKPEAEARLYSVPDGDRTSRYYDICQRAALVPTGTTEPPPVQTGARRFYKFRWPQTLKPAPFWSEQRRAELIEMFGGEDSPGYQHNVLGNQGAAENTVFPWAQFLPCCSYLDEYREVLLSRDQETGQVTLTARRLNPSYVPVRLGDEDDEKSRAQADALTIARDEIDAEDWDPYLALSPLLGHLVEGQLAAGIDCTGQGSRGRKPDPFELVLARVIGDRHRFVGRVQLRGFDYAGQRDVTLAVDALLHPAYGWGLDASGNGSAVEHMLLEGAEVGGRFRSLEGRLTAYLGGTPTTDIDPTSGEPVTDRRTGRDRLVSQKELATVCLERLIQARRGEFPLSLEWLLQWTNHTAAAGASDQRIFAKTNDHLIEAARALETRLLAVAHGDDGPAVYAVHSTTQGRRPFAAFGRRRLAPC